MTDSKTPGLAVLLAKLSKVVYRKTEEALPGTSVKEYMALSNLDERGVPQQRLAESLHMDENNLVLLLNGLEEAGSIARRRDPDDRRRHIVEITAGGKKVLERAERGMAKLEEELLSSLSSSERATLKQLVRRVLESQAASATAQKSPAAYPAGLPR
jgi:DNA-binding MarR family transcriptional regulator